MIQVNASTIRKDPRGGYIVVAPHDYDAMGATLRAAFANECALPRDMTSVLDALDRAPVNVRG